MGWCGFLFSFTYRFALACLAHINWFNTFFHMNCIFFSLWKSYDLLWFWMHFFLCACFPALRPENYLLVWINIVWTKCRKYPNKSYKEVYNILYNRRYTKSERELKKIENEEKDDDDKLEEGRESRVGIDSDDDDDLMREMSSENIKAETIYPRLSAPNSPDGTKAQPSIGVNVDKTSYLYKKEAEVLIESNPQNGTDKKDPTKKPNLKERVIQKLPIPEKIKSKIPHRSSDDEFDDVSTTTGPSTAGQDGKSWTGKLGRFIPSRFQRSVSNDPNAVDVLQPNFSNVHDANSEKDRLKREKQEKKALKKKIDARRKEELRAQARIEQRRRTIAEAIDLLLTILRLMCTYAIMFGLITKTFMPAEYQGGRESVYDTLDLGIIGKLILEVVMYNLMTYWIIFRQWKLFARLGCVKFLLWLFLLGVLGVGCMYMPMRWVHKQLDYNLCVFQANTPLAAYFDSNISDR